MSSVSIKKEFNYATAQEQIEARRVMGAVLADLTALRAEVVLIGTTLADYKAKYDAHTHTQEDGDSAQTSIPDTTAGGVAAATAASVFTDSSTAIAELTLVE